MPIYLVNAVNNPEGVWHAIETKVPEAGDRYKVAPTAWFVKFPGTTKELSDHLGITADPTIVPAPPPPGTALVTLVGSYYGRAQPDMWEWLKTRWG